MGGLEIPREWGLSRESTLILCRLEGKPVFGFGMREFFKPVMGLNKDVDRHP